MKKLIVSVMMVFSASFAYAVSPYDVCNRLSTNSSTLQCAQFVSQCQYFDQTALSVCDRLSTNSSTVQCINVIANKVYDYQAIRLCDGMSTNSATVQCMSQLSGRFCHYNDGSCRN